MRNYLKWYKENLLAPSILVGAFTAVVFLRIPALVANKLAAWLCNLLERNGVDLSRQLTPEEFAFGLMAFLIVLIAFSLFTGMKENETDKSV